MKVGKFFRKLGCLIPPVHINSKKRRCHNRSESKASSASHQTGFLFPEDSCATSVEGSTHRAEPAAADPAKLKAPDTELAACSTPDDRRARSSSPSAPEASGKLVVSVDKTAVETEAAATIAADGVGAKKVATRLVVSKSALVAPCIDAVVVPAILNSNVCENEKTDVGGTEEGRCRCASEATTDSGRESTDAAYYSAESSFVGKTAAQDGGMLGDSAHWEYSGSAGEGSIFGAASPAESLLAQKKDLACDSPSALPMGASPALMTTLLGPNICVQLDSTKTVFSEAPPPNPLLGANNCVKSNSTKTVFSEAPSASAAFAHSVAQDVVLIDTEKAVDELAIADFGSQNAEQTLESSTSAAQAVPAESGYNPTNAKASTVLLGSPEPAITVGHKRVEARNGFSETIYPQVVNAHKSEHVVVGSYRRVIGEKKRTNECKSSAALLVENVTILDVNFNLHIYNEAAAQQDPLDYGAISRTGQLTPAAGYASQKEERSHAYDQLLCDLIARLEGREENEIDRWQLLDGVEDRMLSLRRWVTDYKREESSEEGSKMFILSVKALQMFKSEGRRIHVYTALRNYPDLLIRFHVLLPPNERFPPVPLTLLDFDAWDEALKVGLPEDEVDRKELKELALQACVGCPVPEELMDRAVALLDPCRHMFLILLFSIFLRAEDAERYWTREICPSNGKLLWLLQKSPDNFENFLRDRFVPDSPVS